MTTGRPRLTTATGIPALIIVAMLVFLAACDGSSSLPTATPSTAGGVTPTAINFGSHGTTPSTADMPTNWGPNSDFARELNGDGYRLSSYYGTGLTDADPAVVSVAVLVDPGRGRDLWQTIYDHAVELGKDYAAAVGKGLRLKVVLLEWVPGQPVLDSKDFSVSLGGEEVTPVVILQPFDGPGQGFAQAAWGSGESEVSRGMSGGQEAGPDLMAVSPDGMTVAVYDRYASPARVNYYTRPAFAGSLPLEEPPLAFLVDDERGLYLLYAGEAVRVAPTGEMLGTVAVPAGREPAGLLWAGDDVYLELDAEAEGGPFFVRVWEHGSPVSYPGPAAANGIHEGLPLASGRLELVEEAGGTWLLTVVGVDGTAIEARVQFAEDLAGVPATPCASTLAGRPVLELRASFMELPVAHYVAVDMASGETKTATVALRFGELKGGTVVVGPDAVYVMRHYVDGMQLVRVPFE